jgi:CRISPR-associated protein Cas2
MYDITDNKIRSNVVKQCKNFGLYRVQKSVFLGDINQNEFDEIALFFERLINSEIDAVYIFPMCKEDFGKVRLLGQAFDKELVTDEIKQLFF